MPNVAEQMNGYVGFYAGKRIELHASSLYEAKVNVIAKLKVPKSKQGLVAVVLAEKDGKTVTHSTAGL